MRMRQVDFDATVATHGRRVFTLSVYLLGDHQEAEDVTQEVLIRLWRGMAVENKFTYNFISVKVWAGHPTQI